MVLLDLCSARLRADAIEEFVHSYQEITPFTTGEIWALPAMLRLATIDALAQAAARMAHPEGKELPEAIVRLKGVSDDNLVANTFASLRMLGTRDWNAFFDSVSLVERTLRTDPAGIYGSMDFETRDGYRKVVENLSRATASDEMEVARLAIQLALENWGAKLPADHVGRLGYRPGLSPP